MSITTIISISVKAAGFRLLNKFVFNFVLVNAGQWLASAFAVLLRRATARQEATPNIFASEAGRLRGIISKIVKGVVETRSSKLRLWRGYPLSVIRLQARAGGRGCAEVIPHGWRIGYLASRIEGLGGMAQGGKTTGRLTTNQRIPVLMKFAVNFIGSGVSNLKSAIIPACF